MGPFERYKLVKPFIQEQEKEADALKVKETEFADTQNTSEIRTDENRIESVCSIYINKMYKK